MSYVRRTPKSFRYLTPLVDGVTPVPPTSREGDYATTEHATGDGLLFVSDGASWVAASGPAGPQGPQGEPGGDGIAEVAEDASPSLGGHLDLGAYNINGQLENPALIIDGGLL